MECKNCGTSFEGKFCNACGQNIRVDKLTLGSFMEELSDSIFQINHGLFYTIKSLFLQPGHTIREFLKGKRKAHFKPIAYVLLLSTFYYLITQMLETNTFLEDFLSGVEDSKAEHSENIEKSAILLWLTTNFAYSTLLLIPIFSIATRISFLKKGQNYMEHVVINSYITGQQILCYASFTLLGILMSQVDIMLSIALVLSILFRYWTFIQFYTQENGIKIFLRLVLAYFLFCIFVSTLLIILVF